MSDQLASANAAILRAVRGGISDEDARAHAFHEDGVDLTWCAVQLFDPGQAPEGCTIARSSTRAQRLTNEDANMPTA